MVNYQNGKIYKLCNNVDDEIYVGSTCNPLRIRKGQHKSQAKTQLNREVYKHLNEVGWENVEIILIENHACESKDELHKRERYWIDTLKPSLNKVIPTRTQKEWKEANIEAVSQRDKKYREATREKRKKKYQENKEVILQKQKEYQQKNKEAISQRRKIYTQSNKERKKQYDKEAGKKYREANKEAILQQQKIKITCECGNTLIKRHIIRHQKRKNHLFWEKQYNYIYS